MQLLTRNTQWPLGFKAFEETLSAKVDPPVLVVVNPAAAGGVASASFHLGIWHWLFADPLTQPGLG